MESEDATKIGRFGGSLQLAHVRRLYLGLLVREIKALTSKLHWPMEERAGEQGERPNWVAALYRG